MKIPDSFLKMQNTEQNIRISDNKPVKTGCLGTATNVALGLYGLSHRLHTYYKSSEVVKL